MRILVDTHIYLWMLSWPVKSLPFFHKDPFDRMLIAQSMTNKLTLMSDDSKIKKYDCKLI